jgi:hypothetical protein
VGTGLPSAARLWKQEEEGPPEGPPELVMVVVAVAAASTAAVAVALTATELALMGRPVVSAAAAVAVARRAATGARADSGVVLAVAEWVPALVPQRVSVAARGWLRG